MNENKCYFPGDITIEKEYFSGFGNKELRKTLKGTFVGLVIALALYMGYSNMLVSMSVFIFAAVGSGFLCLRDTRTNISFVDEIKNLLNYIKSQKTFLFQFLDEWR